MDGYDDDAVDNLIREGVLTPAELEASLPDAGSNFSHVGSNDEEDLLLSALATAKTDKQFLVSRLASINAQVRKEKDRVKALKAENVDLVAQLRRARGGSPSSPRGSDGSDHCSVGGGSRFSPTASNARKSAYNNNGKRSKESLVRENEVLLQRLCSLQGEVSQKVGSAFFSAFHADNVFLPLTFAPLLCYFCHLLRPKSRAFWTNPAFEASDSKG